MLHEKRDFALVICRFEVDVARDEMSVAAAGHVLDVLVGLSGEERRRGVRGTRFKVIGQMIELSVSKSLEIKRKTALCEILTNCLT